ncbi:hypothetical protein ACFL1R_08865 [Candidatus Latescibacterota bacterium]
MFMVKKSDVLTVLVILAVFCFMDCGKQRAVKDDTGKEEKRADYGDVYYSESIRVIKEMWEQEKDTIDAMTTRIANTLRAGRTVVWDCTAGHSNIMEVDPMLPCLPKGGMISAMEFSGQKETINKLQKGDMLITNFINEQTVAAHERGVYVIGVTNSYFRCSKFSEQDNLDHKPNYNDLELEDISDEVFDSHVPGQIGLVSMPYIPEMKVGAGVGNFMIALYWLVNSEVANKMVKGPDAPPLEYASQYYDTLMKRLDSILKKQRSSIWSTAEEVAVKVGNGAHMWVDSSPRSVWCDASGASMGLVFTNRWPKNQMKKGDVIFIADVSDSTNSKMVQEAKIAKEKGLYIIAAGPSNQTELKALADVYFDNLSPEGYGLFEIEGHSNKISLVGSLINSMVYGVFSVQMVDEMCQREWYPKYYMSYNWGGASGGYFQWLGWSVNRAGY